MTFSKDLRAMMLDVTELTPETWFYFGATPMLHKGYFWPSFRHLSQEWWFLGPLASYIQITKLVLWALSQAPNVCVVWQLCDHIPVISPVSFSSFVKEEEKEENNQTMDSKIKQENPSKSLQCVVISAYLKVVISVCLPWDHTQHFGFWKSKSQVCSLLSYYFCLILA